MKEKDLEEINNYLRGMGLPFTTPLLEALVLESLVAREGDSNLLVRRLYGLAECIPPGKDGSYNFERLVKALFLERQEKFDGQADQEVAPLRQRLLDILDKWTQLYDFLEEKGGMEGEIKETLAYLEGVEALLGRFNSYRPGDDGAVLAELTQKQDQGFISLLESIDRQVHREASPQPGIETMILRVNLEETEIWRRLRVPAHYNLAEIHEVLQKAMGWWKLHGYRFIQGVISWSLDSLGGGGGPQLRDLLVKRENSFYYDYNLEEPWRHLITLEDIQSSGELSCLAGEGACPPEDCSGPKDFASLLESLREEAPATLKEQFSWVKDFVPERLSLPQINQNLLTLC